MIGDPGHARRCCTPEPYHHDSTLTLYTGDATDTLAVLPDAAAHCVVTSPPYWGLRDYGTGRWVGGQHSLEPSPESYIERLCGVFTELRRVLVDTGTVWLNLGDSYSSEPPGRTRDPIHRKNLMGMPWRVAFALQRDGWIVRNAIVWHKPNAMPESVKDRLSNRYEMLFLLVKQQRYHFDLDRIRLPLSRPKARNEGHPKGKNPGDIWRIPTRPLREAHFAAYPIDIPLRCIAAGCPEVGVVLDPFSGAATTGLAAHQLGRSYIGIDINPEFHDICLRRLGRSSRQRGRAA